MVTPCRSSRFALLQVVWILGGVSSAPLGIGHSRVENFLMSALKESTRHRYQSALTLLNNELENHGVDWLAMTEEQQDMFLAEWLVDGYELGAGRSDYGIALAALGRANPRYRFRTAWKVFDVWGQMQPPMQAGAAPPELLTAMMLAAFALNKVQVAMVICVSFAGLLRVGEALNLHWKDVVIGDHSITLCLASTKRGMEQKVVLTNAVVYWWVCRYKTLYESHFHGRVFSASYSSVLRWVKRLAMLLGAQDLHITTHSFRRSGASELSKRGMPLNDILLYGRWLSERSAREYIRKGEVAIIRAATSVPPIVLRTWNRWATLLPHAWDIHAAMSVVCPMEVAARSVTDDIFRRLSTAVFALFRV